MGALWGLIPSWAKFAFVALLTALLLLAGGYTAGTIKERQRAAVAAAEATAKAIQKRTNIDEKIIGMDAVALCLELGGVPEQCNELRRVEADQP